MVDRPDTLEDWLAALGVTAAKAKRGIPCPSCGGTDRFHLKAGTRGAAVIGGCGPNRAGCNKPLYPDLAREVFGDSENGRGPGEMLHPQRDRAALGPRTGANGAGRPRTPPRPAQAAPGRPGPSHVDKAAVVWAASAEITHHAEHPARLWLAARRLWWGGLPLPAAVRFLKRIPDGVGVAEHLRGKRAVVHLCAPPSAWVAAWPDLPKPSSVRAVFVQLDGTPVLENGGNAKRTFGPSGGAVTLLGAPTPSSYSDRLIVCEGLADGLALAAREPDTVLVSGGLPDVEGPVLDYAASWPAVTIHADHDGGVGEGKAWRMYAALKRREVNADVRSFRPAKDAAARAAQGPPLADLLGWANGEVKALAADYEADAAPRWEALRRAALCIAPASEADGAPDVDPPRRRPSTPPPNDGTARQGGLDGMPARQH